jgi:hypothetical protein
MTGLHFYFSGININTLQMEIEDFFENKQKRHNHGHYNAHHDDHGSQHRREHDSHDHDDHRADNDHGYSERQHDGHKYQDGRSPFESRHDKYKYEHGYSQHGQGHDNLWQPFLAKVNSKPGLKYALIAGAFIVLMLVFALLIAIFPLLIKLWDAFAKSGLQGILNNLLKG